MTFHKRQTLPFHSNGMRFAALDANGETLLKREYYSVGGGFVVNPDEAAADRIVADKTPVPYPFSSGDELLLRAAELRARFAVSLADAWIAAAAIKHDAILAHKDPEFKHLTLDQEVLPFNNRKAG